MRFPSPSRRVERWSLLGALAKGIGLPENPEITSGICGRTCFFRHVDAEEKLSKKSKKGVAKGSVALLKESTQLGCVSQDSHPRKYILREKGKLGSNRAVKFSQGTWHQKKIRKERVHGEVLSKNVNLTSVVLARQHRRKIT